MIIAPATPNHAGSPRYRAGPVWMIALIAALGGLLFGYDWVVIGGAKPFYKRFFGITDPGTQVWAMNCTLVGSLLGACVGRRERSLGQDQAAALGRGAVWPRVHRDGTLFPAA